MLSKIILHQGSLHLYYYKDYNRLRFNLGIKANPEDINKSGFFKKDDKINEYLREQQRKCDSLILEHHNLDVVKAYMLREISEQRQSLAGVRLSEIAEEWIEEKNTTENTIRLYNYWRKTLIDYNENAIPADVDIHFLHGYVRFLQERNIVNNSIAKNLSFFRQLWAWMEKKGVKKNIELQDYRVQTYQPDFVALTKEQLEALKRFQDLTRTERKIRDIFVFLCYTGLRISDYQKLEEHHLQSDYIDMYSKKTKVRFKVPIHDEAKKISKKYLGIVPKHNTTVINRYIKQICKKIPEFQVQANYTEIRANKEVSKHAQLWERITTHTGRHTFATTALLNNVPHNVLMTWCGWKNPGMVFYYADRLKLETKSYMKW